MARPEFAPTAEQREEVEIVAGSGTMTLEEIALGLGISKPTLRKHFEKELAVGAYRRRSEVIAALYRTAVKGSAAAAKAYLAHVPEAAAPPLEPEEKEKQPEGKRERAQADARTAQVGTDWETLLDGSTKLQ